MQIVENVLEAPAAASGMALTIGSFDGVHLGHLRIVEQLVQTARRKKIPPALMTLRPHPREFFSPRTAPNILTSDAQKERLLREAGIEALYYLPFDASVANLSPARFVNDILVARCHASALIVGHDFAFGKDAAGNFAFLEAAAPSQGFEVVEVPALVVQGERVSSTLIREIVLQGDVDVIEMFLGRKYAIDGRVIRGRGMGAKLGFPTANVEPLNKVIPAHGVYAAEVRVNGETHPAAVNIGIAPTIRHEDIMVEAHLLDFDRNLADQVIEIVFHRRLRPEKKYPSYDSLVAAIAKDVEEVRAYFSRK